MAVPTVPRVKENECSKACDINDGSGLPSMVSAIPVLNVSQISIIQYSFILSTGKIIKLASLDTFRWAGTWYMGILGEEDLIK